MPNAHSVVKSQVFSRLLALVLGLTIGLLASPAFASRAIWKQTKVKEEDKSWKVSLEIHLDRAPDIVYMPVRFTFTAKSYFERALVDGRKDPVIRQIPLEHQQPIVESMDVGFLDPGTGKTAKRTRFSFRVSRDRGFEAGTYEVKVTDARSNQDFSGTATLTFDGENEVVDRRSMVFEDKKPKQSDDAPAKEAKPEEKELSPEDDAFWAGGKSAPEEKTAPLPPPAHMQDKPGCGCRVAGAHSSAMSGLLAALAALALLRRRSVRDAE